MRIRKKIAFLVLLCGLWLIVYPGTQLLEARQVFQEANTVYEALRDEVVTDPMFGSKGQLIKQRIDFAALQVVNEDAVAWLYSPDTPIDYPVVKASEYNYYLFHLIDHTYNLNGTLFIDYNNAPDFSERLTVIYGHHMDTEMMFTSLMGYKEQSYYEEHPYMYLYTEAEVYQLDLLYGCVIAAGEWREKAFMYEQNLEELLAYAAHNTSFVSSTSYQEGSKVVALSTCSFEFDSARYVVIGVLKPLRSI